MNILSTYKWHVFSVLYGNQFRCFIERNYCWKHAIYKGGIVLAICLISHCKYVKGPINSFKYGLQRHIHHIPWKLIIAWSKIYSRKGESFYRKVGQKLIHFRYHFYISGYSNRLFWVICITLAWIASGFLILSAWDAFQHNAIQFVVETSYRDWV